ncbi:hypothetical protein QR680_007941 [Steinernema hermaphroditum]|nr:hypothetical protein QR680_007941 [Steinernema hermaphroditum]
MMAAKFHYDLLCTLQAECQKQYDEGFAMPLSLILDTSTDDQGNMYVVFMLRFVVKHVPQLELFRMMLLEGERAIDIFEAFLRAIEQSKYIWKKFSSDPVPDIDAIFTHGLIAMGSDGASVMVAVNNGLPPPLSFAALLFVYS